jgi:arabinogalactan oligomer/maltooligosaccharide transport system substrate-binding protein
MPSVDGVSQIWTPGQTFFIDVAKDAFRPENERKYKDMAALKDGLTEMSQQIYDAINTLQ